MEVDVVAVHINKDKQIDGKRCSRYACYRLPADLLHGRFVHGTNLEVLPDMKIHAAEFRGEFHLYESNCVGTKNCKQQALEYTAASSRRIPPLDLLILTPLYLKLYLRSQPENPRILDERLLLEG